MEYTIFFLATLQAMCDLSSQARDQAHTPCIGAVESWPPGTLGKPLECTILNFILLWRNSFPCGKKTLSGFHGGEIFTKTIIMCHVVFPNITQRSGSNNENKYVKHLTQVVYNLCSSESTNHLKNRLLNSSGYRLFKALKHFFRLQILNSIVYCSLFVVVFFKVRY